MFGGCRVKVEGASSGSGETLNPKPLKGLGFRGIDVLLIQVGGVICQGFKL